MKRHLYCFSLALFLLFAAAGVFSFARAEELYIPPCDEIDFSGVPRQWTEVGGDRRLDILRMPVEALKANLAAVSSCSGKITFEDKSKPVGEAMKEIAAHYDDGLFHNDAEVEFAADYKEHKLYRKARRKAISRTVAGSSADSLSEVGTHFAEETYLAVVTPDGASHREYTEGLDVVGGPDFSDEVPGFPSVPLENLVTVEIPKETPKNAIYYKVYSRDTHTGFDLTCLYGPEEWDSEFDSLFYTVEQKGKCRAESKPERADVFRILEAADENGKKWYGYQHRFESGAEFNILWDQASGFLPSYIFQVNHDKTMNHVKRAKWRLAGGAYVPEEIVRFVYGKEGEITARDVTTLTEMRVNEPVDPEQFTVKALELPEGGIISDRVRKKVFEYKDGKEVFLVKFGSTKYMRGDERKALNAGRVRIALVAAGLALCAAGIFLRLRRRRKTPAV